MKSRLALLEHFGASRRHGKSQQFIADFNPSNRHVWCPTSWKIWRYWSRVGHQWTKHLAPKAVVVSTIYMFNMLPFSSGIRLYNIYVLNASKCIPLWFYTHFSTIFPPFWDDPMFSEDFLGWNHWNHCAMASLAAPRAVACGCRATGPVQRRCPTLGAFPVSGAKAWAMAGSMVVSVLGDHSSWFFIHKWLQTVEHRNMTCVYCILVVASICTISHRTGLFYSVGVPI